MLKKVEKIDCNKGMVGTLDDTAIAIRNNIGADDITKVFEGDYLNNSVKYIITKGEPVRYKAIVHYRYENERVNTMLQLIDTGAEDLVVNQNFGTILRPTSQKIVDFCDSINQLK